jgi:hypothetical protein
MLKPGTNTLLFKVAERGNQWEMACRLLSMDDEVVDEKLDLFKVVTDADGVARFRSLVTPKDDAVIQTAVVQVALRDHPDEVVLHQKLKDAKEMVLKLDSTHYEEYVGRVVMELGGGSIRETEISFAAGPHTEFELFKDGASAYSIVVGDEASE